MAMSKNRCIGKNGGLPWPSMKEDFKWFKEFTMGKYLIVGRKTFDSLPVLNGRKFILITKDLFGRSMMYLDRFDRK
jgi:dihydrofolate reductase